MLIKFIYILIAIKLFFLPLEANEQKLISTKTAVIFNTLCAKCHEGGCSGRLTFHNSQSTATNHIKRYSNNTQLKENELNEFFTLLNYMKKECAILMSNNIKSKSDNISLYTLPSYKGYFIPLGALDKGKYNLSFKLKENISFRIEIISKQLDYLFDEFVCSNKKEYKFSFTIDKTSNGFLRILSKKPLYLKGLKLKKVK